MISEGYLKRFFNEVKNMTAVCRSKVAMQKNKYPELEICMTYHVSYIGVLRSSTNIILAEFEEKEFNSVCFDLYEDGVFLGEAYTQNKRFWAPYLREMVLR